MANEELVNRLRERAKTLWQWAGRAVCTTGPGATTEQWRIDGDLHDDAATEIDRLARELEATRAALRIAQTTTANLHDTIRLRDRDLEEAREQVRALRAYVAAEIEHTVHRVTCETCIVGGECDEEQDLWEKMDQACNLAWELVRPGVMKLRVDAITGALIEAPTSTEARDGE